jgi:hypothetical protein
MAPITVRAGAGSPDAAPKETMMADNVLNPATPGGMNLAELAAHQARLQAAFTMELTVDDVRAIARKLTEQAREGDRTSARLVLKYGLGTALAEAKRPPKPAQDADFVATAQRILKEMDLLEAEERRAYAAPTARAPVPPPRR